MSEKDNIAAARRLFNEVYTGGDTNVLDSLLATNVILFDPSAKDFKGGIQAYKELETMYSTAFPNKRTSIDDLISSDDKVVVRWTVTGIHENELPGIPATNKKINVSGITILKFKSGKITEIWQIWDQLGQLQQLGVQTTKAYASNRK